MVEMVAQPTKANFRTRIRSIGKSATSAVAMVRDWQPKDERKRTALQQVFVRIESLAREAERINEGHE